MTKLFFFTILLLCFGNAVGQHQFSAIVQNKKGEPLQGASAAIKTLQKFSIADSAGVVSIADIPSGNFSIVFSFIGFEDKILLLSFPNNLERTIISLDAVEETEEEIVITSTRTNAFSGNMATRVETISGEELLEKGNMKPGDIRMLLNESTGIQTQQTSATSANASIRIQGLDGKYTQIIRDGFPLYAGFSGGLGLLQIAPLDLQQVEVIKGSASTLYGGGAIAGLVNLVSKKPQDERELNFLLNGTSALGVDASGFYAQKFKKIGTTIYGSFNHGSPYDPASIGLTAIPKFDRFTFNPKIFFLGNVRTTADFGVNATVEKRTGGDVAFIKGNGDSTRSYFEKNVTRRYSTQLSINHSVNELWKVNFKNSVSYYDRTIQLPDYLFSGLQLSSYSEINTSIKHNNSNWLGGLNLLTDNFEQDNADTIIPINYKQTTIGAFVQHTLKLSKAVILETGVRTDYHNVYGLFLLPRFSALLRLNEVFTMRIGAGLGYKTPNEFTEDAERLQFRGVLPIDTKNRKAERSYGGNIDFGFRRSVFGDKLNITFNQLFFFTRINQPLVLTKQSNNRFEFLQPAGYIDTRGAETNLKLSYQHLNLFVGYTLADVTANYGGAKSTFPLVAKHRLNNVLIYEVEEKFKLGLEAYYYSPQKLNDGRVGRAYWLTGFMAERIYERLSLFVNFENFTDTRQTKFENIYTGTISNPVFRDIYAPVDGFVINGGIKLKL